MTVLSAGVAPGPMLVASSGCATATSVPSLDVPSDLVAYVMSLLPRARLRGHVKRATRRIRGPQGRQVTMSRAMIEKCAMYAGYHALTLHGVGERAARPSPLAVLAPAVFCGYHVHCAIGWHGRCSRARAHACGNASAHTSPKLRRASSACAPTWALRGQLLHR